MIRVRFVGGPFDDMVKAIPYYMPEFRGLECVTPVGLHALSEPLPNVVQLVYRFKPIAGILLCDEDCNLMYFFEGRQ